MFADMTFEVFLDTYTEVMQFVHELDKAYKLIGQKYNWRPSLVISGEDDSIELKDDMIMYKVDVWVYEQK